MNSWKVLSEVVQTLIIMSATGGIIALIVFALKSIMKNHLPKNIQYGLWLVVLMAFLVPFSAFLFLPFATPMTPFQEVVDKNVKSTVQWQEELSQEQYGKAYKTLNAQEQIDISYNEIGLMKGSFRDCILCLIIVNGGLNILSVIALSVIDTMKLRRKRIIANDNEMALLHHLYGGSKCPRLYRTPLAASPMLFGVFRTVIYLPDREYSKQQLQYIMLHERMHLQRNDVIIKWISAIAVSIHWFNPIVYLVRREIDHICELSCDEAVINGFDTRKKLGYCDTLIAMMSDTKCSKTIAMCEEKKTLIRRLAAIRDCKKHTKTAIVFSCVLLVVMLIGTILLSAGAGNY